MYAIKLILCLVLLNSYFCTGDKENNTSQQNSSNKSGYSDADGHKNNTSHPKCSQNNLGPQFANEYEKNGKEVAQGLAKQLKLSPQEAGVLQEILVCLGRTIAYFVGSLAVGECNVPVNSNSSQADRNGKIAKVIGQRIGEELVGLPPLNVLQNSKEGKTIPDLNSIIAQLIARFFGTWGDVETAFQRNSPQDAFEAAVKYFDLDADN